MSCENGILKMFWYILKNKVGGTEMKVEIKEYCVRCGICVGLYPELFAHNFDKDCIDVKYDELPAELEETAKNAARDCAVTAIYLKK